MWLALLELWLWMLLLLCPPLLLSLLLLSRLLGVGDFVAAMRSRIAVPSKGAPINSSEVLELRG